MAKSLLYYFQNDLRVTDLPLFEQFLEKTKTTTESNLHCIYVFDPSVLKPTRYQVNGMGSARLAFLIESLLDLAAQLQKLNLSLKILIGEPAASVVEYVRRHDISTLGFSEQVGFDEKRQLDSIVAQLKASEEINCEALLQHQTSLFTAEQLPFETDALPESFSKFRREVEKMDLDDLFNCNGENVIQIDSPLEQYPSSISSLLNEPSVKHTLSQCTQSRRNYFGGATAAQQHCDEYFSIAAPASYKLTRNALDDWTSSTKMSPWLANGSLSVKELWQKVVKFEQHHGANDSTYWIKFELLWREYFYWYADRHQQSLFRFSGIKTSQPLTTFYPERFSKWCNGQTPDRFINAMINQLNQTGFISNRARQLLASYFVNELALDWRYGAAFFQQQLIDYDVSSNWGNWQYLAGVGCDPRGSRKFDIQKQRAQYDPNDTYTNSWAKHDVVQPLDNTDMADWPVS